MFEKCDLRGRSAESVEICYLQREIEWWRAWERLAVAIRSGHISVEQAQKMGELGLKRALLKYEELKQKQSKI